MNVEMMDGRRLGFAMHLFTSTELRALFQSRLSEISSVGLDVFHSRFAHNPDWNPPLAAYDGDLEDELAELEQLYASNPKFIDHAAHILLVGER